MVKIAKQVNTLSKNNRTTLEANIKLFGHDNDYIHMLRVMADVLDLVAAGQDAYCTVGSTKDKKAYTFMVSIDDDRETLYNISLLELSVAAKSLL